MRNPTLRIGAAWLSLFLLAAIFFAPQAFGAVTTTVSTFVNNLLILAGASGSNGFQMNTNGLRGDFGSGSEDHWSSDGDHLIAGTGTGAGYVASATPHTLVSVFTNLRLLAGTTYGGGVLPPRPFTVNAIRYRIRQAGVGGTTNATWRIAGAGNCDCSFACNATVGNYRTTCSGSCAFAASDNLTYSVTSIGDCGAGPDLIGNVSVEGIWQ